MSFIGREHREISRQEPKAPKPQIYTVKKRKAVVVGGWPVCLLVRFFSTISLVCIFCSGCGLLTENMLYKEIEIVSPFSRFMTV